jgi:hypothetical protein
MDNYSIKIWESETQSQGSGHPALAFNKIRAFNAEMALQQVMRENNMFAVFLAEVSWNNGLDRQLFKNYSLE